MGTEEFWVPALVGALGTGAQYVNQKQATNRQNDVQITAQQHQQQLEDQATAQARTLTSQIAKDSPTAIANQSTGDYVSALRKGAAGSTQGGTTTSGTQAGGQSTSSLAPAAGASSRYGADTATAQKQVEDYGNTYAGEMGQMDAAVRQRQNEGLAMQTLGTNLNTLGAKSYTQNFVDQLRASAAGQTNPFVSLMAGLLKNGASAYGMNAGGKTPVNPWLTNGSNGYSATGSALDAGNGLGNLVVA